MSERITLTLVSAGGDDRPVSVRLRQVLKYLLRAQSFRCVDIETDEAAGTDEGAIRLKTRSRTDDISDECASHRLAASCTDGVLRGVDEAANQDCPATTAGQVGGIGFLRRE